MRNELMEHPYLFLAILLAVAWLGAWLARRWRRLWTQLRFARGRQCERDAEALLMERGYRILERQSSRLVQVLVDGHIESVEVIADIIAMKAGRLCLVEVKTGGQAPDPRYSATRRQFLEYSLAFVGYDLVLLDMEARREYRVEFPHATLASRWPERLYLIGTALVVGAALGLALR